MHPRPECPTHHPVLEEAPLRKWRSTRLVMTGSSNLAFHALRQCPNLVDRSRPTPCWIVDWISSSGSATHEAQ